MNEGKKKQLLRGFHTRAHSNPGRPQARYYYAHLIEEKQRLYKTN